MCNWRGSGGKHGNPKASPDQRNKRMRGRTLQNHVRFDMRHFAGSFEQYLRCEPTPDHEPQIGNLRDIDNGQAAPTVLLRQHCENVHRIKQSPPESFIPYRYHRQVDNSMDQTPWQACAPILEQLNVDPGMTASMRLHKVGKGVFYCLRRCPNPKYSRIANAQCPGALSQCVGLAQDDAALAKKVLPGRGQAQATPNPIEQRYTQFRFQSVNLPGTRGLTQVQTGERFREAALLGNVNEGSQLSKIHTDMICKYCMYCTPNNALDTWMDLTYCRTHKLNNAVERTRHD